MHGSQRTARASRRRLQPSDRRRSRKSVQRSGQRETARQTRTRLRRSFDALGPGDVLMVTRLDRLARSTHNLLPIPLAAITRHSNPAIRCARRHVGRYHDAARWPPCHGARRFNLVRARSDPHPHRRRPRPRQGARRQAWPGEPSWQPAPDQGGPTPARQRANRCATSLAPIMSVTARFRGWRRTRSL